MQKKQEMKGGRDPYGTAEEEEISLRKRGEQRKCRKFKDKQRCETENRQEESINSHRRTYSESGETSDMLWEVADLGGEGEGPWAEPLGPGLEVAGGGVRTVELKDARMEDSISRCSLDGGRPRGFGFKPGTWGTV